MQKSIKTVFLLSAKGYFPSIILFIISNKNHQVNDFCPKN